MTLKGHRSHRQVLREGLGVAAPDLVSLVQMEWSGGLASGPAPGSVEGPGGWRVLLGQQQQQEEVLSPHSPGTRGAVKVKCGEEQGDKGVCIVPGTCLDFRTLLSVPVHLQTDSASLFSFRHPNVHAAHPCTPLAPPPPIFLGHPRLVARFSLSTRRGLPLSWALRVLSSLWGEMLLLGPPWG